MIQAGEQLLILVVNSYQLLCVLRLRSKVVQVSKANEESAMIKLSKMSSRHIPVCNIVHNELG